MNANQHESMAKAVAAVAISAAVIVAVYYIKSAWCLWALWLVMFLFC